MNKRSDSLIGKERHHKGNQEYSGRYNVDTGLIAE